PDDDLTSSPEAVAKFERYFEHQLLLAQLCLAYFESRHAIRIVTSRLGLTASLSGAAGVRTRFQQTSHAQLYLSIDARHAGLRDYQAELETSGSQLPRDVAPTDDTLLPTVKFSETDSDAELARLAASNLSPVEQVCLLAASDCHRRSRASDGIIEEELLAYANALLIRPTSWSATAAALLRRSRIELGLLGGSGGSGGASSRARLERALHQLEELSNQLAKPDPEFYPFRQTGEPPATLPGAYPTVDALVCPLASLGYVAMVAGQYAERLCASSMLPTSRQSPAAEGLVHLRLLLFAS
uniref:Protein kinase domain-containing protein n=1 Tax=Macrostomum lignano TaxID=282301 RepID=A0A1I8FH41_9PLAT